MFGDRVVAVAVVVVVVGLLLACGKTTTIAGRQQTTEELGEMCNPCDFSFQKPLTQFGFGTIFRAQL